jgi:hypothetical protein
MTGIHICVPTHTTTLLIVDAEVDDASLLIAGRQPGIDVLRLTPGGRGLQQIAEYLANRHGIASLHILSHGEPGALQLAGERIDVPALAIQRGVLGDIADSLATDATVTLYGCSVAAGKLGRGFLEYLEASLGADVAASVSPVGAAGLGGGWTVRGRDGAAFEPAFAAEARAAFPGLLANTTGTAAAEVLSGTAMICCMAMPGTTRCTAAAVSTRCTAVLGMTSCTARPATTCCSAKTAMMACRVASATTPCMAETATTR